MLTNLFPSNKLLGYYHVVPDGTSYALTFYTGYLSFSSTTL